MAGGRDLRGVARRAARGVGDLRLVRKLGGVDRARRHQRARARPGRHRPTVPVGAQGRAVVARRPPQPVRGGGRRPWQDRRVVTAGRRPPAQGRRVLPHALRVELHAGGHTAWGAPAVLPGVR